MAETQVGQINNYGYRRFALIKAFRRQLDGEIPSGSKGLSLRAVKKISSDLYRIDGQISYDRAKVYADIYRTINPSQLAYIQQMKAGGFSSWHVSPSMEQFVRERMKGVSQDVSVALMTYAGDLYSWHVGSLSSDVYFCPERQGTYFGSFYVKDAPAIGHEGYKIAENLTGDVGQAFLKELADSNLAVVITRLTSSQKKYLYSGSSNIIRQRRKISALLRSLISPTELSDKAKARIRSKVLKESAIYGQLDGIIVYKYAMAFAKVYNLMNKDQKENLAAIRKNIMSGTYNGKAFDFSTCNTPFLFSAPIYDISTLAPYITNTDYLFR